MVETRTTMLLNSSSISRLFRRLLGRAQSTGSKSPVSVSLASAAGKKGIAPTLQSVPRVHSETALQKVGGRWVAATPDDQLHSFEGVSGEVSEVGERIVALIDGRRTVADIVAVVVAEFEVERRVAERDTLRFIGLLAEKHVLSF